MVWTKPDIDAGGTRTRNLETGDLQQHRRADAVEKTFGGGIGWDTSDVAREVQATVGGWRGWRGQDRSLIPCLERGGIDVTSAV